jgi:Zn finger protein HypA/HybF involved in hydrogenase expression
MMEETITCPGCGHEFKVKMWSTGSCPNCEEHDYYFDSTCDEPLGFFWD